MKDNNLMKYKEIKRRLMALVLASSIGITSFGLAGCGKRKIETQGETNGYYDVFERDNNLKVYFTDEWFCDVWAEDYDNNKLSGIVFELRDGKNNLVDQWTSSNEPHRIKGLDKGKYILTEINVVGDYMTANNNYTYEIEAGINKYDILAIKHIKKGNVINQRTSNVLTTGKKEYINDELFVLKLRDCYVNRMNNKDFIVDDNNKNIDVDSIPKYLLLKGSTEDKVENVSCGSIQYSFRDAVTISDSDVSASSVSVVCNKDGSYQTILYRTSLGIMGAIYNDDIFMVPLDNLSKQEINELIEQYKDNDTIMDILSLEGYHYDDSYTLNKTKVLKLN